MALRLIVAALVVGAGIMIIQTTRPQFAVRPLYILLALSAVTGGGAYAVFRAGVSFRAGVWVVTVLDLFLCAAVIHYSGGVASQFSMIYCLSIMAAAFLLQMRGGLGAAALATVLFLGYALAEHGGLVSPATGGGAVAPPESLGILDLYMHVSVFFLVGAVGGYLADRINRNRRELESAETRLQQLRIDTDFIVSNMSSGVLVIDNDGLVVNMNPAAERILRSSGDEMLMGHIDAALGTRAPAMAAEMAWVLEHEQSKLRHEIQVEWTDDKPMPLGISISLLRDTDGHKRGVIAVFKDLTEVREMQERIRKADRLAAVGELSAGIAHELRNPLASISGSIELLYNELQLDGENRRLMELIMRESDRLDRIITDFLSFARLRPPRKRPVDVWACLDEVLLLVRNNAAVVEGVDIVLDADDDLPPIRVDDEQIRQVFFNLVVNSCEAMTDGGRLEIRLTAPRADEVCISFCDQGPGIDTDDVDRLFEPFFTTKTDGTGLGLAIANKIVAAHGGTVRFENRPEGGAAFSIVLPAGRIQPASAGDSQKENGRVSDTAPDNAPDGAPVGAAL
jgi:two-component system sensor histidine kinase PilS (NtrC family)